jgi:glycosyltransferase involved in cell wall biosynthesis
MELQDVGVVIIGRNEGERLRNCIASVKLQTDVIVYVDSGSTDDSVNYAKKTGVTTIFLNPSRPFTAARARNEGFGELKSIAPELRFVQFIDGDCLLVDGWIQKAIHFLHERPEVAVVCGRRRERFPEASLYNRLIDLEWNTPVGEARACGGDALMRVAAFESVGGFASFIVAGEEPDLCFRMRKKGWMVWRLEAEMTQHDAAIAHFGQWWRRSVRSGFGAAQIWHLHRSSQLAEFANGVIRAAIWGGLAPIIIMGGFIVNAKVFLTLLIYPLQVCRIAISRGAMSEESWAYGLIMTLSKFAELQGISKYVWDFAKGTVPAPIEYK